MVEERKSFFLSTNIPLLPKQPLWHINIVERKKSQEKCVCAVEVDILPSLINYHSHNHSHNHNHNHNQMERDVITIAIATTM